MVSQIRPNSCTNESRIVYRPNFIVSDLFLQSFSSIPMNKKHVFTMSILYSFCCHLKIFLISMVCRLCWIEQIPKPTTFGFAFSTKQLWKTKWTVLFMRMCRRALALPDWLRVTSGPLETAQETKTREIVSMYNLQMALATAQRPHWQVCSAKQKEMGIKQRDRKWHFGATFFFWLCQSEMPGDVIYKSSTVPSLRTEQIKPTMSN